MAISAAQLDVYNEALDHLGLAELSSITEDAETRRVFDRRWDNIVERCLIAKPWNFALKTILLSGDAPADALSLDGWGLGYPKPYDWLATDYVNRTGRATSPPIFFEDKQQHWFIESAPAYVSYWSREFVDPALWPANFRSYVAVMLAMETCKRLTGSDSRQQDLFQLTKRQLSVAASNDARDQVFSPEVHGSWVGAKHGAFGYRNGGHRH